MNTMQNSGLMQNQPSIKPPVVQNVRGNGGILGGPVGMEGSMTPDEIARWKASQTSSAPQPSAPQPNAPQPSAPQPSAPMPTAGNAPAPGMDYLEGVRSREQRNMDRQLAEAIASSRKRGLNTSAIGQTLENTARADLGQRMQENISAEAFKDYQMKQQQAHETAMQQLVGNQALQQQNNSVDQQLRGAKGMIPITTEEYQAGIDAYKQNFPQLFNQQAEPQNYTSSPGNMGGVGGDDPASRALALIYGGSGGRTRDDLLSGGGTANVPQIGPGSSPSNAVGGPDTNDPSFGYSSGPIGPNGSRTTRPTTNQPVDNGNTARSGVAGSTANVPMPSGWTPQTSGPLQNMSPITDRFRPQTGAQVPQFSGGPRPTNTSPLQASTNSLGLPGIK